VSSFWQGYLRHTREQLILTALSESHAQLTNSFYTTLDSRLRSSWDSQKRKILEEVGAGDVSTAGVDALGASVLGKSSALGASAFGRSVRGRMGESLSGSYGAGGATNGEGGTPQAGQTLAIHQRLLKYDSIVRSLNASRLQPSPSPYPLLKTYASSLSSPANNNSASTSGPSVNPLLAQTFSLLSYLVREGEQGVGERSYARGYVGDNGEGGRKVRRGLVEGGKKFLEEQYVSYPIFRSRVKAEANLPCSVSPLR
jgi:nuclear pore complex protein Nup93